MEVGEVRVAEDNDFEVLKIYLNRNDGWNLEYKRGQTLVWTRHVPDTSDFKMIRVSLMTSFPMDLGLVVRGGFVVVLCYRLDYEIREGGDSNPPPFVHYEDQNFLLFLHP